MVGRRATTPIEGPGKKFLPGKKAAFFCLGSLSDCQPSKEDESVGVGRIMSYSWNKVAKVPLLSKSHCAEMKHPVDTGQNVPAQGYLC